MTLDNDVPEFKIAKFRHDLNQDDSVRAELEELYEAFQMGMSWQGEIERCGSTERINELVTALNAARNYRVRFYPYWSRMCDEMAQAIIERNRELLWS